MSGSGSLTSVGSHSLYSGGLSSVSGGSFPALVLEDESGILARLRRRRLTFLVTFAVVSGLVGVAYGLMPRTYRATASVLVSSADVVLGTPQTPATQQNVGDPADLESQTVVLSSTLLARRVLERPEIRAALIGECEMSQPPPFVAALKEWIGLGSAQSCADQVDDTAAEVTTLQNRFTVTASGRSRVIDVSFGSPSPQIAQLMTNTLVQDYLDLRTQEKLKPRETAIEWLRAEIDRLGAKLKTSERTIEAFLHEHGLVKGQAAPIASERLSALSQQLAAAEADLAATAGRQGQAAAGGSLRDVLDSRSVGDLKQQLATVDGQIALLSNRYGPAYPGLAALQRQRAMLQAAVGQETGRVTASVGHDYQAALSRVTSLTKELDGLKKEVGAGDDATTQIATLQRDADVDRELYLDLTKKVNELEAESRLVVGDARLVNLAELPDKVFFPKKLTFGLTGLLLASALATVVALLRDRGDRTVRTAASLQAAAGVRVLAHIPQVRRVGQGGSRLTHQLDQPSAFQEAIRALYAECMLVDGDPLRTLLVTSSHLGEGKTFVTLALAHFAAAAGQRVLVLECDLRRPSFGPALSLRAERGMSDYLRGKARPEEIVCRGGVEGLDAILSGKPAINSTELLSHRRMRQLLEWAAPHYDLVLIDTPPSQVLRDARVLARQVDGVLYCAQWGRSQLSSVLDGVHEVQAAGGRVIGLVLDRVEAEQYRLYNAHTSMPDTYLALGAS